MNLFIHIASLIVIFAFDQYCMLTTLYPQCPLRGQIIANTQFYRLYKFEQRHLRIYKDLNLFRITAKNAERLRLFKISDQQWVSRIENVYLICQENDHFGGIVTDASQMLYLENGGPVGPTAAVRDILMAISTFHAAHIFGLHLNDAHLRLSAGHVILQIGPAYKGSYRGILLFMPPEVLKDIQVSYPNSDVWFAGVVYFRLLTNTHLLPHTLSMYGNLDEISSLEINSISFEDQVLLRWMTYFVWRVMFTNQESDSSEQDLEMHHKLTLQNKFDVTKLRTLRHRMQVKLDNAHIGVEAAQVLRGLLTFDYERRLTVGDALTMLPPN